MDDVSNKQKAHYGNVVLLQDRVSPSTAAIITSGGA